MLHNMGSVVTDGNITIEAKSIDIVQHICQTFQKETGTSTTSGHHSIPSFEADFKLILSTLEEQRVFSPEQHKGNIPVLNFRTIYLKVKNLLL